MDYKLKDLIEIPKLRELLDSLSEILKLSTTILDDQGSILIDSAWQNICTKFHRVHPETKKDCLRNEVHFSGLKDKDSKPVVFKCVNGLVDITTPIMINNKEIGILYIGQFLLKRPNLQYFKKRAKKYGFNERKYLAEVKKVPVINKKELSVYLNFIQKFTETLANIATKNFNEIKDKEKLQKSEERFKAISEYTYDWETWISPEGKILWINSAVQKISGYSREEYAKFKNRLERIIYKDDKEKMLAHFEKALKEKYSENNIEFRLICKDQTIKWVSVSYQPIFNSEGEYLGIRSSIRNINDRKIIEESLENSEKKFREMFNKHHAIMLLISPADGSIIDANIAAIRFYGYSSEDFKKMNINKINLLSDKEIKKEMHAAEMEQRNYFVFRHRLSNDVIKIVEVHTTPIEIGKRRVLFSIIHDITDRTQKEDEIKKLTRELELLVAERTKKSISSERKYRTLFNQIKDGIILSNLEGKILEVNQAYCEMLGYTSQEIMELSLDEITPSKWRETDDYHFNKQVLIKGFSTEYEKENICKNGSVIIVSVRMYITELQMGKPKYVWQIIKDMTEFKLTQQSLKDSELKFRTVADFTHDWEYWIDQNNKLIYSSPSCNRITGYTHEEFMNDSSMITKIIHPEDQFIFLHHLNENYLIDDKYDISFRIISRDGRIRWIEHRCVPVFGENKEFLGRRSSNREITDRKRIEEKLKSNEEAMRAILNSVSESIYLIDSAGTIIMLNATLANRFDSSVDELIGKNFFDLLEPEIADNRQAKVKEVLRTGQPLEFDDFRRGRYIHNIIFPVSDENEIKRLAVWELDITEQKIAEKALKETSEELDRFFNLTLDMLCIADTNGYFIRLNPAWETVLGYKIQDLAGSRFLDYIHPDDMKATLDAIANLAHGKKVINFTNRYQCKDGSYKWIEWESAPYEDILIYAAARDITEKKISDANVYRLQIILEQSLNEIYIFDAVSLHFIYVNNGACRNLKYSMDALQSMTPVDIKPEFTHEEFVKMIQPLYRNEKEILDFYTYHQRSDGSVYPVEVHLQLIKTDVDVVFLAMIIDITDRKQSEEALALLNNRFETAVKSAALGIWDWDVQKNILIWDERMFDLYDISRETQLITYEGWLQKIFVEDRAGIDMEIKKTLLGSGEFDCEFRILTAEDEIRFIKAFARVIRDKNGTPQRMVGVNYDITEQNLNEKRTYESEQMLRLVLDHIPQRVFWKNTDLLYLGCNMNFAKDTGFGQPSEIIGKNDFDLAWKENAHLYRFDDTNVINNDEAKLDYEEPQHHMDGSLTWLKTNKIPLHDKDGKVIGLLGTYEDITEKRLADKILKDLIKKLETSNKELENFAYIASHDLQEPLRMVSSYTQLLAKRYKGKLDSDADEFIGYAVDGAVRMQRLINDLLDYSRIATRGNLFQYVNAGIILDQALINLKLKIEDSEAIIQKTDLPMIKCDENQIIRVFQNLIDNAIKYRSDQVPIIQISAEQKEEEWQFAIADNGIGIETQYSERIFDIFQRLHPRNMYPGTGVGLSICKKIIDRHGGKIWVESEPCKGSIFYFTIPKKEIENE